MGEISDLHIRNFEDGRWAADRVQTAQRTYPTARREDIAGNRFAVVRVVGGRTNRMPGTLLIVCDQNDEHYWVWTSKGVTGIAKAVCQVICNDLSLQEALTRLNRKPWAASEGAGRLGEAVPGPVSKPAIINEAAATRSLTTGGTESKPKLRPLPVPRR